MKIAVTAASGRLGHAILRHLAEAVPVDDIVAIARSPERVKAQDIEVRTGDYASIGSMTAAFAGIERAIMISAPVAPGTDRVTLHRNVIEAARRADVKWLVYTSVIGNGRELETWFGPTQAVNRQTEEDLKASGLEWTIARNALYLDLDLAHIRRAQESGGIYANPGGKGRAGYLSIDEIAFGCARLVTDARHRGRTLNIVGDCWTQAEIVDAACRVFGFDVRYEALSDEDYVARFQKLMPERGEVVARMLTGAFQCIRLGAYDVPSDFEEVTGRRAKSLEAMLETLR